MSPFTSKYRHSSVPLLFATGLLAQGAEGESGRLIKTADRISGDTAASRSGGLSGGRNRNELKH